MFVSFYKKNINEDSGIAVEAYKIGNELFIRQMVGIYQTADTADEVSSCSLYLDVETTKNLIIHLQEAINSFSKNGE